MKPELQNDKIIDKICKCLRLAESGNANEAASALRQAHRLMQKHGISEEQLASANVAEISVDGGYRYNPPGWAVSLSDLVARVFDCRVLISRSYGRSPEFRFIGLEQTPRFASYSFTVLQRQLEQVREDFADELVDQPEAEQARRLEVFTQGWLFTVARTVADFAGSKEAEKAVDAYVQKQYGDTPDFASWEQSETRAEVEDYDDILHGMRAGQGVSLLHSIDVFAPSFLPSLKQTA